MLHLESVKEYGIKSALHQIKKDRCTRGISKGETQNNHRRFRDVVYLDQLIECCRLQMNE